MFSCSCEPETAFFQRQNRQNTQSRRFIYMEKKNPNVKFLPARRSAQFLSLKERLCFLDDNAVQRKDCNHIRNRHQTVDNIRNRPDSGHRQVRTDKDNQNVQPAVRRNDIGESVGQILQTAL